MNRTITVKGTGKASASPDYVILGMSLSSQEMEYDDAMALAAQRIDRIGQAVRPLGFDPTDVKTTGFQVDTHYDRYQDEDGHWCREFDGYVVSHNLTLGFDFDAKKLSAVLGAITSCGANPELSIRFTLKDDTAVKEELLCSATRSAKRKAEVLCRAADVRLGQLLQMDYNWSEMRLFSPTRYALESDSIQMCCSAPEVDFTPDDIDLSDSVAFVWEIV